VSDDEPDESLALYAGLPITGLVLLVVLVVVVVLLRRQVARTAVGMLSVLAERYNTKFGYCHDMSFVACLYSKKTRIMRFSMKSSKICQWGGKFDGEIRRGSPYWGNQIRVGWFSTSFASRKRWFIGDCIV